MRPPSNGITADVIRDCMKPYGFNPDLLEDTVDTLPPPPEGASPAWRHRRLTRLVQEMAIFMPADDAQARLAAQVIVLRELAGTLERRALLAGTSVAEMCRLSRCAMDVTRTAFGAERALARRQKGPAPFYGTWLSDPVDIGALDAVWGKGVGEIAAEGGVEAMDREDEGGRGELTAGEVPRGMAGSSPAMTELAVTESVVAAESAVMTDSAVTEANGDGTEPMDRMPPGTCPGGETAGECSSLTARDDADPIYPETEGEIPMPAVAVPAPATRRQGVIVEQGEGWSLEIWPARAGIAAAGTTDPSITP